MPSMTAVGDRLFLRGGGIYCVGCKSMNASLILHYTVGVRLCLLVQQKPVRNAEFSSVYNSFFDLCHSTYEKNTFSVRKALSM
jgi:hypothetical protein